MPDSRERLTARKVAAEDIINGDYHSQEGFDPNYLITPYGLKVSRARLLGTVVDQYVNDDESYGALTLDDGTETIRLKFFQDLDMMEDVEAGDIVEVMGKVKQYDGEIYVTPELLTRRGPEYELLRALELEQVRQEWRDHIDTAKELQDAGKSDNDIVQELQGEGLQEDDAKAVLAFINMEDAFSSGSETDTPSQPRQGQTATASGQDDDAADAEDENRRKTVLDVIEALDEGDGAEYGDIQDEAGLDEEALEDVINDLLSDGTCYEPRPGRIKRL